ncbi:MAG: UDP-glucose dehydrogenase family protein [Ferruginibacter sp.]
MKIAVVGTGYVGLVTGTCFAETGNQVYCVDVDVQKVEKLRSGQITIYEPGLEKLFLRNIKEHRLFFTTSLEEAVIQSDVIFLALPTPPGADGSADLSAVLNVASALGNILKSNQYKVIVDKSTVPVGTADLVRDTILANGSANRTIDFDVVSNPEFLREGFAVEDFMKPDRVVIGSDTDRAFQVMQELYAPFVRQGNPIIRMDVRSAELTKYAANSFLAVKISFMNEIAQLCERMGADVDHVRKGIGSDDRIGKRFLFSGIGYGGSCFPKDVLALSHSSITYGYDFRILDAVINVNAAQKLHLLPKIESYFGGSVSGKRLALWGLAFKPNTDDIRQAPAFDMIRALLDRGASVCAYDPEAMPNAKQHWGEAISFADSQYGALEGADALIIATEWNEFRTPDFERIASLLHHKAIFDGRNLFELNTMRSLGFHYESVGRQPVKNR